MEEAALSVEAAAAANEASEPFVGRWNQLVSTTNWEKGRIIVQWRQALIDKSAPATEYSDEAWSRRVGGVTGQHVGRLRRVYQRFSSSYESYQGLYWTHFQAALDWEDAEMWLEGAVQSKWSVSQMRRQRWETMGALPAEEPQDADIIANETDEDFEPALNEDPDAEVRSEVDNLGPRPDGPDFGDEDEPGDLEADSTILVEDQPTAGPAVRPFENLNELPADLADAFEAYKLAILAHKSDQWEQVACEDVLASLDALKALAVAPSNDEATA